MGNVSQNLSFLPCDSVFHLPVFCFMLVPWSHDSKDKVYRDLLYAPLNHTFICDLEQKAHKCHKQKKKKSDSLIMLQNK